MEPGPDSYAGLISLPAPPSSLFTSCGPILSTIHRIRFRAMDLALAFDRDGVVDRLDYQLSAASEPARHLFDKIIASVCTRIPILAKAGKASRLRRLIETGSWT